MLCSLLHITPVSLLNNYMTMKTWCII